MDFTDHPDRAADVRMDLRAGQTRSSASPPAERTPARRLGTLRALLPFITPYRRQIALALLLLVLASITTLVLPYAVRMLVDSGRMLPANAGVGERLVAMRGQFVWLYATVIALAAFSSARFYMVTWIGERVTADLRQAVYAHVLRQSPQFFETLKTGEVLSRLTTDTTVIQNAVGSSVSMGLRSSVLFVGALAMLIATSPRLMLTVAGVITAGQLSEIALYITLAASSVAMLAEVWGDLLRAAAATERLSELLATRPAIADPAAPRELPPAPAGADPHPRPLSHSVGEGSKTTVSHGVGEGRVRTGLRVDLQEVSFAYPSR